MHPLKSGNSGTQRFLHPFYSTLPRVHAVRLLLGRKLIRSFVEYLPSTAAQQIRAGLITVDEAPILYQQIGLCRLFEQGPKATFTQTQPPVEMVNGAHTGQKHQAQNGQ